MRILTRQEAEKMFGESDVVSSTLEFTGSGLRINLTFSDRNALLCEYKVGRQGKVYCLEESGVGRP